MRQTRSPAPSGQRAAWSPSEAARGSGGCGLQRPCHLRIRRGRPPRSTRPALRPEGSHLSQVAGPPSLFFSGDSLQRTILAEGAARQRRVRRHWNQLDSRCEVESMRNSKITSADTIAIVIDLTSSLEAGIKCHTAVHEERRSLNVIRLIAREPNGGAPDLFRFADAFVWNQLKQLGVVLGRVPGLHVDRCADRTRRDGVHTNPEWRDFLSYAFHHQHYAAFGGRVIHVTCPRNHFMD